MSDTKRTKILVVDDELGIRELMSEILADEGYSVALAENAEAAWRARVEEQPAMILLDIWMPDLDGVTLLRRWADAGLLDIPVVVMSGHATIDTAVEAMKLGAVEVLEKPIAMARLLRAVENALATRAGAGANPFIQQTDFGSTAAMRKLKGELLGAASEGYPALFLGAPDSGARFFAQYLCPPKLWPVFINSGAQLDEGIRPILRRAEGGLVVIRMVNWFSPTHQSGLLGLVREASREGIRVAALSAEPLTALAERGECSEALANAFSKRVIQVPPLNAYQEDIPKIVALMVRRLGTETDLTGRRLTTQAVNFLCNRSYENDFAELTAIVRGALLVAAEGKADATVVAAMAEKVGGVGAGVGAEAFSLPLREAREIFEREYFRRLIRAARGNMQRAAQTAGLERAYFYRKLKQLQIKD